MRRSKRGIALGAALCVLTLVVSVLLQKAGYLIYLNSDMASEIILANRQAQTHSLVQMDWLYSTEIHSVHMNLFYALAFVFTPSYEAARIIGNTLVFVMGMAACAGLCSARAVAGRVALRGGNASAGGEHRLCGKHDRRRILHHSSGFRFLGRGAVAESGAAEKKAEYGGVCGNLPGGRALLGALCALLPVSDGRCGGA